MSSITSIISSIQLPLQNRESHIYIPNIMPWSPPIGNSILQSQDTFAYSIIFSCRNGTCIILRSKSCTNHILPCITFRCDRIRLMPTFTLRQNSTNTSRFGSGSRYFPVPGNTGSYFCSFGRKGSNTTH